MRLIAICVLLTINCSLLTVHCSAQQRVQSVIDSALSHVNMEEIKKSMKNDFDRQWLADSLKAAEKLKIAAIKLEKQKSYTYMAVGGMLLLAGVLFFNVKGRRKSETVRE